MTTSLSRTPHRKTLAAGAVSALALGMLAFSGAAHADSLATLDSYIKSTRAGYADFTQVVTNANKPGAGKQSVGTFAFKRPNQFRFDYRKPFQQTILADGKTLWMYDADLNQVTQRSQAKVLDSTPAALVASATSIESLKQRFTLEAVPVKDRLEWVKATPKDKDGQLQNVMIGFDGKQLRKLEILDSFGQRSVMTFGNFVPTVPAKVSFKFKVPAGADVLKQ